MVEEDFLPTPADGEDEGDFIQRCMEEMLDRRHRVGTARNLCSIAWRSNVQPPATAAVTGEPSLVAPPPIRTDIPDELSDLFDFSTNLSRSQVREAFLRAVETLGDAWTIDRIERELRTAGNLDAFLDDSQEAQDAFGEFREMYRDVYEGPRDEDGLRDGKETSAIALTFVSASDGAAATAPIRGDWWSHDRWIREAVSWIDTHGANRVTAVGQSTKEGIRSLVREAFEMGRDRDWIARSLEVMDGDGTLRLGLDARRNRTLLRFADALDDDVPAARRTKLIERRYRQLLKDRAATIAQTETMEAANAAQMNTFSEAAKEGELDTQVYVIEWIARAIRCPRCAAMDGSTREILSGQFVSDGTGPKGIEMSEMPDLHPRGWCFTRIIPRADAKRLPTVVNIAPAWPSRESLLMAA